MCQKALKRITRSAKLKGDVGSQPVCSGLSGVSPVLCQSPRYTCLIGESAAESLGLLRRIKLGDTHFKCLIKIFFFRMTVVEPKMFLSETDPSEQVREPVLWSKHAHAEDLRSAQLPVMALL